jgi:ribonucleoside-triphosphate reductase (thioredoxin)
VQVVVRDGDTAADLEAKVRLAAVLGTWQATLTKWKESEGGLRPAWRENTEQERLLGVSLTGIMDNALTSGQRGMDELAGTLQRLRAAAADMNAAAASDIGIGRAAAVTCVKPSGTVSQLVDAASGIHSRHARHYVRRVRGSNGDPLTCFLAEAGVPHEPCVYNRGSTVRSCA